MNFLSQNAIFISLKFCLKEGAILTQRSQVGKKSQALVIREGSHLTPCGK